MPNKKEPLSLIAVKTLLAVIIFTGVGTIIVGGGWLIGKREVVMNDKPVELITNKTNKANSIKIAEAKCPENWKEYKHDVIGIKFCYPEQWGEPVTKPKKEITRIEDVVSEFKDEHNLYYNSFFIEFENEDVSLRFFNERYGGEYYPNVYAYTYGYIDNIPLLKTTGDICEYKIDFKKYKDKLNEIYSNCDGNTKTAVIENYQYFDFIGDVNKSRYSYDLKGFAYKKLFNGYFDNLLISTRFGYISQNKEQLATFEEILSSLGKSKDQFKKEKDEFANFVKSVELYQPTFKTFPEFETVQGEDSQVTMIRRYYWLLTNGKLNEAYKMRSDKEKLSYKTFQDWYKDIYYAKPYDFKKVNSDKYEFYVEYQDHNKPKTKFRVTMSTSESELKTLSSDEILTEEVSFGEYSAYAIKRGDKNYMILSKNGEENIIDEGYASYDLKYSSLGNVKFFREPKFSPRGNYLIYTMLGWEWSVKYVYDIKKKEVKISKSYDKSNFTPDEKFFYGCSSVGMGRASGEVYSVPDFNVEFDALNGSRNYNRFEVDCKYDENSKNIMFILSDDKGEEKETISFSTDWKIYRNERYGFELKYPENWYVYDSEPNNIRLQPEPEEDQQGLIPGPASQAFQVIILKEVDLEILIAEDFQGISHKQSEVLIDGNKGIEVKQTEGAINQTPYIYLSKNNKTYKIKKNLGDIDTFNQILSTFKFIEKNENSNQEISRDVIRENILISLNGFDYILETFGDWLNPDQRIVKIDKANKREILISSVKNKLPELKERRNILLSKFVAQPGSDLIFLRSVLMDTDNPGGIIYSYDITTNEFKKLKINEIYNGFFGSFALSPDQTRFVWIPQITDNGDDKEMYLINLIKDEYKLLIKLENNETFNGGREAMLSHQFVEWIGDSKIKYAIYDQSKKSIPSYDLDHHFQESIDKILIEYREMIIK